MRASHHGARNSRLSPPHNLAKVEEPLLNLSDAEDSKDGEGEA